MHFFKGFGTHTLLAAFTYLETCRLAIYQQVFGASISTHQMYFLSPVFGSISLHGLHKLLGLTQPQFTGYPRYAAGRRTQTVGQFLVLRVFEVLSEPDKLLVCQILGLHATHFSNITSNPHELATSSSSFAPLLSHQSFSM